MVNSNNRTTKPDSYEGWNTSSHVNEFSFWNSLSKPTFNFAYGNFQENRYLLEIFKSKNVKNVLDIGCATGTTYRLLSNKIRSSNFNYKGYDISETAVNYALALYNKNLFYSSHLHDFRNLKANEREVIFSRDTVMHQDEPFKFLKALIEYSSRFLILRLRTRDNGETVWDTSSSCQMHYDKFWMPYIVINIDELIEFILSIRKPVSIKVNRSYEVLGGFNFRFLPKDLYFKSAGGAETSLCIEFDNTGEVDTRITFTENLEGQSFLQRNRFKYIAYKLFFDKLFYSQR